MSIQAVGWVLDQHPDNLPGKAKLVLAAIANHADHRTGYCWLAMETISHESSMPVRSLYRYIGALVRNGYLRKQLRKGADGKQRATDYWLLFNREPKAWVWDARGLDTADEETQDVVEPSATMADGEIEAEHEGPPVESAVLADGPSAIGGSRNTDEPSKTKPSYEKEGTGLALATPPRNYRPPPIEPMGAVLDPQGRQIFVIHGTRAWNAWEAHRKRENRGIGNPTTTASVNGKQCRGWYFPTLFPPSTGTNPPASVTDVTDDEAEQLFANR
jgi:Helix-turn-helix domain